MKSFWRKISILKSIKAFLKKFNVPITMTISSIFSLLLALGSNCLYTKLGELIKEHLSMPAWLVIAGTFIVATFLLIFLTACLIEAIKKKLFPEAWDDRYMKHAFLHLKSLGADRQASFQESFQESLCLLEREQLDQFLVNESVRCIQLAVKNCYLFFSSAFSNTGELVNDIRFEVTFMTKSYKDDKITIPCSANKENRTPVSMLIREENPDVFNKTETAKVYAMDRPRMILVEDTMDRESYVAIYENQKERIRSTVILPVLSHRYELLGTLVVHCNQPHFFKKVREDFWRELLEIFSVEIGYYKLMLNLLIEYDQSHNKSLNMPF